MVMMKHRDDRRASEFTFLSTIFDLASNDGVYIYGSVYLIQYLHV